MSSKKVLIDGDVKSGQEGKYLSYEEQEEIRRKETDEYIEDLGGAEFGMDIDKVGVEEKDIDQSNFVLGTEYTDAGLRRGRDAQARSASEMQAAQLGPAAQIDTQQQDQFRGDQRSLIAALQARAAGEGTSIAQLQLQKGRDDAIRSAMALAASQSGLSPAAAQQMAQNAATTQNMQTNQQMAILRAGEQAQAEQTLGSIISGGRGQDIGLATSQAGLEQQTMIQQAQFEQGAGQQNLQSQISQKAMNDQMTQYYISQGFTQDEAQLKANQNLEGLKLDQARVRANILQGEQERQVSREAAEKNFVSNLFGTIGGVLSAGGEVAGQVISKASDKNLKKDIKRSDKKIDDFLNAIKSQEWKYKDEKHGVGDHYGVMAQDLQKSEVGSSMVQETPEGLVVNVVSGFGPVLASLSRLNKRQKEIEKKLGAK